MIPQLNLTLNVNALEDAAEYRRVLYIKKIYEIVTRQVNWEYDYIPVNEAGEFITSVDKTTAQHVLAKRFGTVDLVSPSVSIMTSAVMGRTKQRVLEEEPLNGLGIPETIISELKKAIASNEWEFAVRKAVRDCVMYGTGFLLAWAEENNGVIKCGISPLPFHTTVTVDPLDENRVTELLAQWAGQNRSTVRRKITETSDTVEVNNLPTTKENIFGFVPAAIIKNPLSPQESSPYGFPMFAALADASMFVSGACNDMSFLLRHIATSILYITGARIQDAKNAAGPLRLLVVPDENAKVGMLTPSANLSEISEFISSYVKRMVATSGIPPDMLEPRSLSNTGAGAVTTLLEPMKAAAAITRNEVIKKENMLLRMLAKMLMLLNGLSVDGIDFDEAFKLNSQYVDMSPASTQAEVQALVMAVENRLMDFEAARQRLNPDEPLDKSREAAEQWEKEREAKANALTNIL